MQDGLYELREGGVNEGPETPLGSVAPPDV